MASHARAITALAGAAVLAAPAAAPAATVSVPACSPYVAGEPTVSVQGSGFAPNGLVAIRAGGQALGTARTDASGAFSTVTPAPSLSSARRNLQTFELTADDSQGNVGTASLQVTRVTADLPDRARPSSRVRYRVFGFTLGRVVWVHVRRGGRTLATVRIGRASGPCGRASRRLRYLPLDRYRTGTYEYWFQMSRRFDRDAPGVRLRVSIIRRARSS
jgi:hypothetical protein